MKRIIRKMLCSMRRTQGGPILNQGLCDFVFIHINKTGGTSIASAIGLSSKQHLTATEIVEIVGMNRYSYAYKFAVVRNPWARCVSQYNYRVKTNQNEMGDGHIDFREWVDRVFGQNKDQRYYDSAKFFQPQSDWLKVEGSDVAIEEVIKFETLADGFCKVAKRIGVVHSLPHYNKTQSGNWQSYYDSKTAKIVSKWFEQDIDLYGYQF